MIHRRKPLPHTCARTVTVTLTLAFYFGFYKSSILMFVHLFPMLWYSLGSIVEENTLFPC